MEILFMQIFEKRVVFPPPGRVGGEGMVQKQRAGRRIKQEIFTFRIGLQAALFLDFL
jgi:hypothetical protein